MIQVYLQKENKLVTCDAVLIRRTESVRELYIPGVSKDFVTHAYILHDTGYIDTVGERLFNGDLVETDFGPGMVYMPHNQPLVLMMHACLILDNCKVKKVGNILVDKPITNETTHLKWVEKLTETL